MIINTRTISKNGRFAWMPWMFASVIWDAVASGILTRYMSLGAAVELIIYTPTGAFFLWSLERGLGVGAAYILFGILVALTNGIGGLMLGQMPHNPLLAVGGAILGIFAVSLGSHIRAVNETAPNRKAFYVIVTAVVVTIVALTILNRNMIMGVIIAAIATGLWDISATPISQTAEKIFVKKTNNRSLRISKLLIRLVAFVPTSYMYSQVLSKSEGLLDTAIMVGVTSAVLAPIMEAMIYGGKESRNFKLLPLIIVCGAAAILAIKAAF